MSTIRETLTEALNTTQSERELAEALLRSGAVPTALQQAAYTDEAVQKKLGYAKATLRAQLSKARRQVRPAFPQPILEGRWWLKCEISTYHTDHARGTRTTSRASTTSSTGDTSNASTASTTGNARIAGTTSSTGDTRSTSSTGVASITSSTGNAGICP